MSAQLSLTFKADSPAKRKTKPKRGTPHPECPHCGGPLNGRGPDLSRVFLDPADFELARLRSIGACRWCIEVRIFNVGVWKRYNAYEARRKLAGPVFRLPDELPGGEAI